MNTKTRRIPIQDFLKLPEETSFQISPNGMYISCLKPYKSRLNIFIKNPNGEDLRITDCEDRNIANYVFANDSRIVYSKDNGGDENYRLFAIDVDGKNLKEVAGFDGVNASVINELKDDNDHVLICMNKRTRQFFDIYKLNIYTGDMEMVLENPGGVNDWIVDHKSEIRVCLKRDGLDTKILYRETINDDFKLILEGNFKENALPIGFSEDNKNLIILSNFGRDMYGLYEYDPINEKNIKLIYENPEFDVKSVIISKKNNRLIGCDYASYKMLYKFFDDTTENVYNKIKEKLTDDSIIFCGIDREENKIVLEAYSDKNPGVYYLYDVEKDKLTKIAEVKPWINKEEMAQVKPIKYTSRDGLTIQGYLTIPKGIETKNLPVIIIPHGGPWSRDLWCFRGDIQLWANRGYAVLQMDFRGSIGYGRKFKEAGFKQWGKTMQDDITDGVNWLIKEGIADPNKVSIYGKSYGGYATLAGLAFTPDLYVCGVDVVGPSNIFTLLEAFPPSWEPMRKAMYEMMGDPEVDIELLREASPLFHVDNIIKPLFVIQGAKDPRVPQSEADQIVEALRAKGLEVKYMLKENEGHGFTNEENILEMFSEVEKFLEEHIK